jgi:hypothetical protein
MTVQDINKIRYREMHTVEILETKPYSLDFKSIIEKLNLQNCQVVVGFQQNWSIQDVRHYILSNIKLLILFGVGKTATELEEIYDRTYLQKGS